MPSGPAVLLCGVSTRFAAESAARAGFAVTALDAFADRDQHPAVRALSMPRDFGSPFTAAAAAHAARSVTVDAVAYLSPFENNPAATAVLSDGRSLWGNAPSVLRRARDPQALAATLRERGLAAPRVAFTRAEAVGNANASWMLKPRRSGGGHGVRRWDGAAIPAGAYLQEFIDGAAASIVFVAARGQAVMLGITRQLIGDAGFGASGFRYCGSILPAANDPHAGVLASVAPEARKLAAAATDAFGLVGVNNIDIVVRDGTAWPVEINPRWSASLELVERACGIPVFAAHAAACTTGTLPDPRRRPEGIAGRSNGKAVLFARRDLRAGATDGWLAAGDIRDVPHAGAAFAAGEPVCTILATESDGASCEAALRARAGELYAEMDAW